MGGRCVASICSKKKEDKIGRREALDRNNQHFVMMYRWVKCTVE